MCFLTLKKGRRVPSENIILENTEIRELNGETTYKYLGIEESEKVENDIMKERIRKEYLERLNKILQTELKLKNKIEAIKVLAVPVLGYSVGIVDWFQYELNELNIRTRKMHVYKLIYKSQFLARIYMP